MNDPAIFIAAVSREFASTRRRVANTLTRLGYTPVWQDIFGSEPGDLRQVLRDKIDGCDGLLQIVGEGYGAEPPTSDPEFGRVSYTQFEFLYAQQRGKKTWLILAGEACARDTPLEQLDLPRDPEHSDALAYQAERRQLQHDYRQQVEAGGHLHYQPSSDDQLDLIIERLRDELTALRREFRQWQETVARGLADLAAGQKVTSARIRTHLLEASERRRDEDFILAETASKSDERERLREAATQAHTRRLSRIDDLATSFSELESQADATSVLREMTRTLTEEGVDAALAYVDRQRQGALERVRIRAANVQAQNRTELLPFLKAAELQSTKGQTAEARSSYQQILDLEPDWSEALEAFAWFLFDQSIQSEENSTLSAAVSDAEHALVLAQRQQARNRATSESQRLLTAVLEQMADVLTVRRQPGDVDQALKHYIRSLDLRETLLKAHPDSAQAARDVSVSLNKLGVFLARLRRRDADQALKYFTRSLELREDLLRADPDSTQAARDVSVSLNQLGSLLARRGQPGDADQALKYFTRSLELREDLFRANPDSARAARDVSLSLNNLGGFLDNHDRFERFKRRRSQGAPLPSSASSDDTNQPLKYYTHCNELLEALLKAHPDSTQAARDVSVSLNQLGSFLARRGQPGDADQALKYFTRSLELREDLFRANPDSARAARDVSLSLERLGLLLVWRGQPGDADQGRKHYIRGLQLAETLLQANPGSTQATRDVEDLSFAMANLGAIIAGWKTRGLFMPVREGGEEFPERQAIIRRLPRPDDRLGS